MAERLVGQSIQLEFDFQPSLSGRPIGHVTGTAVPDVLRRSGYLCRTVLATSSAAV